MPIPTVFAANQQIGALTVKGPNPERDKWGALQWDVECTCGLPLSVSFRHLRGKRLPECRHMLRTIAEVEASCAMRCADNCGDDFSRSTIYSWHTAGKLKEGKLEGGVLVPEDAHYFRERVQDYFKGDVYFYDLNRLADVSAKRSKDRHTNRWKTIGEIENYRGLEYVREAYILRELNITKPGLAYWDKEGWPLLRGAHPETISIHGVTYYNKKTIDEVKNRLNILPTEIPDDHPELCSLRRTADLIGLAETSLAGPAAREAHGLISQEYLVRIPFKDRDGTSHQITKTVPGCTRASVHEFMKRKEKGAIPPGTITLQNLATRLSAFNRSTVTPSLLNRWCNEKLLDATTTDYWTEKGFKDGCWVITDESAKTAEETLRDSGWDNSKATRALRAARSRALKDGNGEPPQSVALTRLMELRQRVDDEWVRRQQSLDMAKATKEKAVVVIEPAMISIREASLLTGIDEGTISRAVDRNEIKNNGQKGKGKRKIDNADFTRWKLERDKKRR